MTAPPEGAQISEDGHYWWDEQSQQWQTIANAGDQDGGASGSHDGGAPAQDAGTAQIVFADMNSLGENAGASPLLSIDPDDNPNNDDVPHTDCGISAAWADFNRGTADAQGYSDTWTLNPAGSTQGSGSVDGLNLPKGRGEMRGVKLGRLPAGHYDFTVTLPSGVSSQQLNFEVTDVPGGGGTP